MAVLAFILFTTALVVSLYAVFDALEPRRAYIAALLSGSAAAPALRHKPARRRIRRIAPMPIAREVRMLQRLSAAA